MCDINEKYRNKLKRVKECYEEIITEMKKEDVNNFVVKDWIDEKEIMHKSIVFIFACPGREEFIGNKPCCGQTGKNLDKFINHLEGYLSVKSEEFKEEFNQAEQKNEDYKQSGDKLKPRYKFAILNSSDKVHFAALDNGSLPSDEEIASKVNNDLKVNKKIEILKKAKLIFCFGDEAKVYYDKTKKKLEIIKPIECCHLGNQAINTKYPNKTLSAKKPEDRRHERIQKLFNDKKPVIEAILKGASEDFNPSSQEQKN